MATGTGKTSVACLTTMISSTSNIEAVARDICSRQLSRHGASGVDLAADVDRYWHCVAAGLEAGQIDDAGNQMSLFDLEENLKANRSPLSIMSSAFTQPDQVREMPA